jgi:crotonobetainyl-CoA:carnitine CoA-transferase CaiB-like acyl-CoA transferase
MISSVRPLDGIRVLDLTLALAGPLCTQRLGDLGAEVIKVEGPDRPDFTRNAPMQDVRLGGETTAYLSLNRNKKSLAVDLKHPDGLAIVQQLAARVDVVVQNFRPGVATRLGGDAERLSAINPRLVYVAISGYGEEGPLVSRPGQDLLVQSISGTLMNAGTADGLPHPAPIYVVDVAASHLACEAVLAGLIERGRTGVGVQAKVSLLEAVLEIQIQEVTTALTTRRLAPRGTSPYASVWMEPPYGIYRCADGFLSIAQSPLSLVAAVLGANELEKLADERPDPSDRAAIDAWRDKVYPVIAARLAQRNTLPTVEAFLEAGVWSSEVLDYFGLEAHPQSRELFIDIDHPRAGRMRTLAPSIRFPGRELTPPTPAPSLGEHSDAVLASLGYSAAAIETLRERSVVQ